MVLTLCHYQILAFVLSSEVHCIRIHNSHSLFKNKLLVNPTMLLNLQKKIAVTFKETSHDNYSFCGNAGVANIIFPEGIQIYY